MKNKTLLYWTCQSGGWLFYGLSTVLFSFTTDHNLANFRYNRLAIGILLGFLFTHLLRTFIVSLKLRPPFEKKKWWLLLGVLIGTAYLYSITNSAFVEWLHLYNPVKKVSVQQRSFYNLLSDTPIIFIWTSFYYLWHYIEINTTSEIDKIRLESTVKDLELRTIKSHINPHFIFNALNSIRALVDENPERARTAITELSNILRSSMQVEKIETAPMERELNIVKDYLALEYIRFEDRLKVEYYINENTLDQPVPPMMLQTLVENAIKHGISKHKEGGLVKITSNFSNTHHQLIVENTGHLSDNYNVDGFGIASTQNRLKLLYGKQATFELKDVGDNLVQAKVSIPI
ncbi:MAG: histidine kinase [Pedobacter sp.]|nr:histidine kinase [Chitinophagaceae bacterium]